MVATAELGRDSRAARLAHCDLVLVCCVRGDLVKARYHAAGAQELGEQAGIPTAANQSLYSWGLIHKVEGDYARALECFDELLQRTRRVRDVDHELAALIGAACAHRELGSLDEALSHAQQAFALTDELGYRVTETEALVELAETHLALGRFVRARQQAERAVDLGRETGHRLAEAKALRALAATVSRTEGSEAALTHWHAARTLFAQLGSPEAERISVG